MLNTLALVSATLSLVAGAVTPTGPAPGAIYNAGATCPISWGLDATATWTAMEIDLMTGSNLAMVKVATVATGLDGTTGNGTYSWACPSVTPNSAIYFYQFTNGGIDPAWTGRFTIASASGATTPPTNATQPDNTGAIVNIPWGTGRLSGAVVTPTNGTGVVSISSTSAITGNATRATVVPSTTSAVALSTLASATTSSRATSTSASSTASRPAASASTTATSNAHARIAGSIVFASLGAIGMWLATRRALFDLSKLPAYEHSFRGLPPSIPSPRATSSTGGHSPDPSSTFPPPGRQTPSHESLGHVCSAHRGSRTTRYSTVAPAHSVIPAESTAIASPPFVLLPSIPSPHPYDPFPRSTLHPTDDLTCPHSTPSTPLDLPRPSLPLLPQMSSSTPAVPSASAAPPATSKFAVSAIPAFKANYAQVAAKSSLSPPAVKDATASPAGRTSSVKVEGVNAPAVRTEPNVAFGNVSDKNAPVSSSPAAPPTFNGNPKAFGTVPAVATTTKATIDLHSFFTGGGSPSLSPATIPTERRSVATFDPSSRSPQPSPSVLGGGQLHPSQLSGNSHTFAPRGQPPIPFVPQQQQQQQPFPTPSPQFSHPHLPPPAGYQHGQQQHQPGPGYLQHKSTPSQNIPNGAPLQQQQSYGGPGGVNSSSGGPGQQQRNGQFGSPVMQQRQPQTPSRGQFGPTSPRASNAGLPQGGMMGFPPQWQGQQPGYGGPPQYPYYPQQQGFAPSFVPQQMQQQQQGGPQSIPLPIAGSGASTPSVAGVRTPSTVGPSSPAAPLSMGGPPSLSSNTSYNSYSSPQPQSAVLPQHPLSNAHSPYTPTSLRAPQSPFSLSGAANAAEFRPNVDAPSFVLPSPRKSAAIQIRNPKTMPKKEVVAEAIPAVAEVKVESKDAAAAVVVAEETAAAAAAAAKDAAAAAKIVEEKKAADALAEKARVEKDAVDAKDKADKEAKVAEEAATATAAAAVVAAAAVAAAAAAAAATAAAAAAAVVEEKKVEDAAAAAKVAPAAPATPVLPSFLPAKPAAVEAAATIPTPAAAPSTPTEGAHSTDISVESESGKYRYDRDFLVQFMLVCMEKADHLPNLEAIGMVDGGGDSGRSSSFAGSRRTPSQMGPPAVPVRGSSGAGFSRNASGGAFGGMGNFGVSSGASPLSTSQARFEASAGGGRSSSGSNFVPSSSNQRVRSVRGQPREENKRGGGGGGGGGGGKNGHVTGQGFEDAPPLVHSAERWMPTVVSGPTATAADPDSPEMVVRKVKALLNKLTLEKFDSISDQILAWADKSVNETDGRILRQVIALIFEKATDEANWSEMYARLCRKLMEMVSVNVKDDTVKGPDGSSVAGGALFRKYLLNRCQEDYESGWKLKEVAAAAAAGKAADDHAKKEANDAAKKEEEEKEGAGAGSSSNSAPKEAELLSDEYYAAQKAKRRGLGLVRFIGELFQLTMLTERIMHECIKKLLANTTDPEEEDVESLCRLLTTIGKSLDVPKAKQHMDIYFGRMKTIADNMKISSRIRFMIQDVLELRSQRWQPRHDSAGPKLISEIHSDAQRATEEASRRSASSSGKGMPRLQDQLSRPNSRRGQGRDGQFGVAAPSVDGWSAPVPQRQAKAGDLSSFGKIREPAASISLGPSGAFANRARAKEAARPVTPSNPFAILSGGDTPADASVSQRPVLNLLRRTKPMPLDGAAEEEKPEEEVVEEEEEEDDDGAIDPNAISMSRAEGERRADNSVKEFFAVKNLAEGVASVEALPVEYRGFLIAALADAAVNKKADDVNLVRRLFAEIVSKSVVAHAVMLASLTGIAKGMVDLAVDIPGLYAFTAQLLIGAGASRAEVEELSLKMESEEEEEEEVQSGRKALLAAFDKLLA